MTEFVKFTEVNDHEGETWVFWLQKDGNDEGLQALADVIEHLEALKGPQEDYQIELDTVLPEEHVDILVEHGGQGYMNYQNKVLGVLDATKVPGLLEEDEQWGWNLDSLYKGRVESLYMSDKES